MVQFTNSFLSGILECVMCGYSPRREFGGGGLGLGLGGTTTKKITALGEWWAYDVK